MLYWRLPGTTKWDVHPPLQWLDERPHLIAVAAEPLPSRIVVLILEVDGNAVVGGGEEILLQAVVELLGAGHRP